MQSQGATKLELELRDCLCLWEQTPCNEFQTRLSVALSNAIGELQRLRGFWLPAHKDCIDHTTCQGMMNARDHCIHAQAKEIDELRKELARERQLKQGERDTFVAAIAPFVKQPKFFIDPMNDQQLPDDCKVGGVKIADWKRMRTLWQEVGDQQSLDDLVASGGLAGAT